MDLRRLAALADRQGGVVSVRQVVELGMPRSSLDDLVRRWGLDRPHRGVVVLPGADRSRPLTRLWIGLCAVGSPAWASARTAAAIHLGTPLPQRVELAVPPDRRPSGPNWVRIRRLRLLPEDVSMRDGVPVVAIGRALRETAALEPHGETLGVVAAAVQQRLTSLVALDAATGGRAPGGVALRRVVADLSGTAAESALAHRTTRLLRAAGLRVEAEVPIVLGDGRRFVLDLVLAGTRVAIEVDGHAVHGRRATASSDRARSNALTLAGWQVLRVDWLRLERDAQGFVAEVRSAATSMTHPTPAWSR